MGGGGCGGGGEMQAAQAFDRYGPGQDYGGGVVSWLFVFPSLVGGGGGDVLLL